MTFAAVAAFGVLWPSIAAAGGGGGGGGTHCPGFAEGATVEMYDNCFAGTTHFVEPGTEVTVKNAGSLPHSLTAVDGSFDTGTLEAGETTTVALDQAGIVRVYCTLHGSRDGGGMAGTFVVGDGGAEARAETTVDAEPVSTRSAGAASSPVIDEDGLSVVASVALIAAVFCGGLGAAALTLQLVRARK
jgi:plastocyanin